MFDLDIAKLRAIDARFAGRVHTRYSTGLALDEAIKKADLVIGAVLVPPGAKAPVLVPPNSLVAQMKPGAVLVDIAIDQGGCFEDSHPPHDPRRADLQRPRHHLLLCGQHAGHRRPHVDRRR